MEQITIFRQIRVIEQITEDSKRMALKLINDELIGIAAEQKLFEEKKNKALTEASLKGSDSNQIARFRQQFDTEGAKYHLKRDELIMRISDINELSVGQEVVVAEIEGPYDVKVGDVLDSAAQAEIVIKDGIVTEIR